MGADTSHAPDYLLVDHDRDHSERLASALRSCAGDLGIEVRFAENYGTCMATAAERIPDRAIVEMWLDDEASGFDVVRDLHRRYPTTRSLVVTHHPSLEGLRTAMACGALDLIQKTLDPGAIVQAFSVPRRTRAELSRLDVRVATLEEVEWEHMHRIMALAGGNTTLAAEALGIDRSTLYRKLGQPPSASPKPVTYASMTNRARAAAIRRPGRPSAVRARDSEH